MKKINRLQLFLAIILSAISFQSFGFWIFGEGSHQGITKDAATEYKYTPSTNKYDEICNSGTGCSFTEPVIEILKDGVKSIDEGILAADPNYHCDDERIQECSNIIFNKRKYIANFIITAVKKYKTGSTTGYDIVSLELLQNILGKTFHTLQDFYSHTNWVERKLYGTNGKHKIPYDFTQSPLVNGKRIGYFQKLIKEPYIYNKLVKNVTCDTSEDNLLDSGTLITLNRLISGFYHETPDIYEFISLNTVFYSVEDDLDNRIGADTITYNGPFYEGWKFKEMVVQSKSIFVYEVMPALKIEKCQHGDKFESFLTRRHFGIAKDQPTRKHHATARISATLASTNLIESIVEDVKKSEGKNEFVDRAILEFLGHYRGEASINTNVNALHLGGCRSQGVPNTLDPNWKKGNTNWQTCNVVNACLEVGACGSDKSTDLLAKDNASITKTASRNDSDEFCTGTQAVSIGTANADSRLDSTAFLSSNVSVSISKPSKFCNSTWYNTSAYSELEDTIHIVGGDLGTHKGLILHFTVSSGLSPGSAHGWPADTEVQLLDTKGDKSICSQKIGFFPVLKDDRTVVIESFNYGEFSSAACTLELPPNFIGRDFRYAIGLQVNALSSYAGTSTADATVRLSKITFNDGVTTPESIGARIEFNSGIPSPN